MVVDLMVINILFKLLDNHISQLFLIFKKYIQKIFTQINKQAIALFAVIAFII